MSKRFVADASVTVAWVHPAQATPATAAMLHAMETGSTIEVPALWPLEVANALLVLVQRKKLLEEDREAALVTLRDLPVQIDHEMAALAFSRLSVIAAKHTISLFDATYLELAKRRRLPLACRDGPLREAAKKAGVKLWVFRG